MLVFLTGSDLVQVQHRNLISSNEPHWNLVQFLKNIDASRMHSALIPLPSPADIIDFFPFRSHQNS